MLTLGIETSCDETSCAVLKGKDRILSNVVSSSLFRHKPFGGVVPEIASRHCLEQIDVVFKESLKQARVKADSLHLIAVTEGPGLIGSLLVGVSFAKALSFRLRRPLVGVNHLEAHLSANFIGQKEPRQYVGLLVSGGHTSLSYHEKGKTKLLGATVDDAVGEAYDKVAKILGLGYPGGPVLDRLAQKGNPKAFKFTKPKQKNRFDFSFSGIKTAVLYEVQKIFFGMSKKETQKARVHPRRIVIPAEAGIQKINFAGFPIKSFGNDTPIARRGRTRRSEVKDSDDFVRNIAASFQDSVVSWLVEKTLEAAAVKKTGDIVVGGGVSANSRLRKVLSGEGKKRGIKVWFPPFSLTVDNAAMIARRGVELFREGKRESLTLTGKANLPMG